MTTLRIVDNSVSPGLLNRMAECRDSCIAAERSRRADVLHETAPERRRNLEWIGDLEDLAFEIPFTWWEKLIMYGAAIALAVELVKAAL